MVKRVALVAFALVVATGPLAAAQSGDAQKILADARAALGGSKLDAVKTLTMSGQSLRTSLSGTTIAGDFEVNVELPDKFMRRDMVANMGNMSIYRMSGFNGDGLINEVDTPPQLSGGGNVVMFRMGGPGGASMPGGTPPTPEQKEAARKAALLASKQDFARLMLGIFATSLPAYPLDMTYAGSAESPDGKADVIEVKGEGDFTARLFIDTKTHLPLMLSWMAKEPLQIVRQIGGPDQSRTVIGGGATVKEAPPGKLSPEEQEKFTAQMAAQAKEADAKRRVVEFRLFYADYRAVDGIQVPFRIERSVDGKPAEEITFDKVKVNGKSDPKKFAVSK
jgi:hypothetical protein